MQTDQRILLVGNQSERINRLSCVFEFLGEQVELLAVDRLESRMSNTRYRALVIAQEAQSKTLLQSIATSMPWQPILLLGSNGDVTAGNVLGCIEEPLNYPQLTELLHFCQVFVQAKRPDIPTSGNQTKLFRSLVGRSEGIAQVRHLINQVAGSDATVLVQIGRAHV